MSEASGDDAAVYRLADGTGRDRHPRLLHAARRRPVRLGADRRRERAERRVRDGRCAGARAERRRVAGRCAAARDARRRVARRPRDRRRAPVSPVVGGHTITTEKEPLYGMVAVGFANLDALIRNTEARPGMALVLTKPIGVGMIIDGRQARRRDRCAARRRDHDDDHAERSRVPRGGRVRGHRRHGRDRLRTPRPPPQAPRGERVRGDPRRERRAAARWRARPRAA